MQEKKSKIRLVILLAGLVGVLAFAFRDFRISRYWPHTTVSVGHEILVLDDTRVPGLGSYIKDAIAARFACPVRIMPSPFCLDFAYRYGRHQYDYNDILYTLGPRIIGKEGKVLLLTDKDTFGQTFTWSAGTAAVNGNLLLVSACRLNPGFWGFNSDPVLQRVRTDKIVLHELGHCYGIVHEHAFDTNCIMFDTNSCDDIDKVQPVFTGQCLDHMRPYLKSSWIQAQ
jgi:predicted Zn-dependent protease